ncbi:MAG TPA: HD domain-containing protein [Pseudonocardiaceae bacterium]|nr:HD domain-containing protein [Pseudonocardiaceae bacterium]
MAAHVHNGQRRKSGDPYITHPIAVAKIVTEIGMSPDTVCAALLHDTVKDTDYSLARLKEDFGDAVAHLVEGVTKLDKIKISADEEVGSVRDAVLQTAPDSRILVLKLADRLHNLRTIHFLPPAKQALKARETLKFLVPVAQQLGISTTLNRELEDLATGILYPAVHDPRPDQRRRTVAERALGASILLLPAAHRARWREEWTGELSVLPNHRARARFSLHVLRGMPRLTVILRRPAARHGYRLASAIIDKTASVLGIIGAVLVAVTRCEFAAWMIAAVALGGLILLGVVLFARSDDPANRLRALIHAWRDRDSDARRNDVSDPMRRYR